MHGGGPKVLHLADVHLDRPFIGLSVAVARQRRNELRDALDRALVLAAERGVSVITLGGDLWEDEHVTPDTCKWVADRFASAGVPVVVIAGNHDPLRAGGPTAESNGSRTFTCSRRIRRPTSIAWSH
jgi:DNA repair exonuclease SbcCD nuclease subunit